LNAFPYGYHNLVLHALDAAFSTTWFSHKWIPSTKGEPEQETHAGLDPLASPDTARSSAWWFKLTVFLLIPVLVPFFVAGSLRALLEEFMTPGLFAVAEATFLFVLGGHFGISAFGPFGAKSTVSNRYCRNVPQRNGNEPAIPPLV
jgi:hypothetical protein